MAATKTTHLMGEAEKLKRLETPPETMSNSIEWTYSGVKFLIFSEYSTENPETFSKIASQKKIYVIGGAFEKERISVSMFDPDGNLLGKRYKTHLTPADINAGKKPGDGIYPFELTAKDKKITVLPIICYELLFPEDWMNSKAKPSFITHHVGFPMFDAIQDEDWFGMQKVLALRFKCDVVVACGDVTDGKGINNTGVVRYNSGKPERLLIKQKKR